MSEHSTNHGQTLFHGHLSICKRCRENPMDLCPAGRQVLEAAVSGDVGLLLRPLPPEEPTALESLLGSKEAEEKFREVARGTRLEPWLQFL